MDLTAGGNTHGRRTMSPMSDTAPGSRTPEQEDDVRMIRDPLRWPNWPYLPLKRATESGMETGFLYVWDDDSLHTVFMANLTAFSKMDTDQRRAVEQKSYSDVEALVDDGWEVD